MATTDHKIRSGTVALDHLSTKMAQEVLAAETRAFGNKVAKQNLQMATAALAHAKKVQSNENVASSDLVEKKK